MANPPIKNIYHLRTVAETASKPCMVCFKGSTAVLITPENKDFFYICRSHLKDKGFATPIVDADAEKRKKDTALQEEKDRVVKEYREKIASKEKQKEKSKKNSDKKDGMDKEGDENDDKTKSEGKEKEDKQKDIKDGADKTVETSTTDELPRIYALHRNFYQMRLDRLRKAEMAKRNRELLKNPNSFPSVPKDLP